MLTENGRERGQVLVLIILAIVGIMGFAALAVDVGRVYAERRRAQNAADAASMAWAFAAVHNNNTDASTAMNSLNQNDYTDVPGRTEITLNHPPASGPYAGNDDYFQVIISSTVDQVFGQFIRPGPYDLTVESVSHALQAQGISPGNAIVAMSETECPGIVFNGGMITTVTGGNIYSNSNGTGPGSCYSGIVTGGSGSIIVSGGQVLIAAGWEDTSGGAYVDPPAVPYVGHTTFPDVDVPVCPWDDPADVVTPNNGTHTLSPGIYNAPVHINNGDWTMEPGFYCFYNDLTINGGNPGASLVGDDVMIVMYSGSVNIGGSFEVTLDRPNYIEDRNGKNFGGFLFFMPYNNSGGIDISGSSGTTYSGTIYAPGPRSPASQEKCNLGGNGDTMGLDSSVMCHTIGIAGGSIINVDYQEETNYRNAPTIELAQ